MKQPWFRQLSLAAIAWMLIASSLSAEDVSRNPSEMPVKETSRNSEESVKTQLLGERFLQAIKDDNIIAYAKCWAPWSIIAYFWTGQTVPSDFPHDYRSSYLEYDRVVRDSYPVLREVLLEITDNDLTQLKVLRVRIDEIAIRQIPPEGREDVPAIALAVNLRCKKARKCEITLGTPDGTEIRIPAGMAFAYDCTGCEESASDIKWFWYFAGRPSFAGISGITITRNGEEEKVRLSRPPLD